MLNKTAVALDSQQDAALLHISQVEGGSTRRMQTVSAAHSNCVSTCYAARIWAKCTAGRLQHISTKHSTACSLVHCLSYLLHIGPCHVPLRLSFFWGRPEPYSAQRTYLQAINRSAGAVSVAGSNVIMRTILMFTPKSTMNKVNGVYSYEAGYYTAYSPDSGLLVLVDCSVSGRLLHPPVSLQQ